MSPAPPPPHTPLLDAHRSGLFRAPAASLSRLREQATQAGLLTWQLDLSKVHDEATTLAAFAATLHFPPWFGRNRDALADCLLDLSWCEAKGYLLCITHLHSLQARAPDTAHMLLDVLQHCASVWAGDGVPFWVVFDLGASDSMPRLDLPQ